MIAFWRWLLGDWRHRDARARDVLVRKLGRFDSTIADYKRANGVLFAARKKKKVGPDAP